MDGLRNVQPMVDGAFDVTKYSLGKVHVGFGRRMHEQASLLDSKAYVWACEREVLKPPVRLQYLVGLASGLPSVMEGFHMGSTGVSHGLQLDMLAHVKRSEAYWCWDRTIPSV
jgi:hypothetical protein